jgi:hypothetical protein
MAGATALEALDLLDRLLDRISPEAIEAQDDADLTHDLAWGLKEVSIAMFARSLYGEERARSWPNLVAYLAHHHGDLAVRLPASDLLTRMVWQQLLARRHHPAVLGAKIWAALWRALDGGGPVSVLIPLQGNWEITLVSRPLGPDDFALLLPPGSGPALALDLTRSVPAGELPEGHPALDSDGSLGALLGG